LTRFRWQDAGRLAQKVVSNYGMSDLGITVHAPPAGGAGFQRKSYEVGQVSTAPAAAVTPVLGHGMSVAFGY